jgi:hypothetical protein
MDPLISGLFTGGANLLSSVFSSQQSASNTQAQIAASEQEQASQNQFSEQMSNTAYQRASADMKAAGLNPMMMFGSGSAASSPTGSSIQAPMPQTTSPLAGVGKAAESFVNSAIASKTMDKMTEEIANLKTDRALTEADTRLRDVQKPQVQTSTALEAAKIPLTQAQTHAVNTDQQNEEIKKQIYGNEATQALHEREYREKYPWMDVGAAGGRQLTDIVHPFVSSADAVRRFMPGRYFFNQ